MASRAQLEQIRKALPMGGSQGHPPGMATMPQQSDPATPGESGGMYL